MNGLGCVMCCGEWRDLKSEIRKAESRRGRGLPITNLERIAKLRADIDSCRHGGRDTQ